MKLGGWRDWARTLARNTYALYLAARDPRVPMLAKLIIGVVVAYALSPIDLIPDFIPVIGLLDDLLLLPLGIWLALRLVPREVWEECQARAASHAPVMTGGGGAAVVIFTIWGLLAAAVALWLWPIVASVDHGS